MTRLPALTVCAVMRSLKAHILPWPDNDKLNEILRKDKVAKGLLIGNFALAQGDCLSRERFHRLAVYKRSYPERPVR